MGNVDYSLLTRFVRSRREHADERAGRRDVEQLLTLLEARVHELRSAEPARRRTGPPRRRPPVSTDRDA